MYNIHKLINKRNIRMDKIRKKKIIFLISNVLQYALFT